MFRACELVLVNKIDLLPHVDFDLDRFLHHLDAVHPGVRAPAGQRAHRARASTRCATGWPGCRGVPRPGPRLACDRRGGDRRGPHRRAAGRARRRGRALLRRRGRPARPAVSPDGRALRARRAAAGLRRECDRRLRRAPRRRRVRPSGDRRQACAAGAGPAARRARADRAAGRHRDRLRLGRRGRGGGRRGRAAALPTLAFTHVGADLEFVPASEDPFIDQELVETTYHVLWELVHVFFEHRGLLCEQRWSTTPARRASSTRSWASDEDRPRTRCSPTSRRRPRPRRPRSAGCGPQTLTDGPDAWPRPRAARLRRRRRMLALGNGGSATDAQDASPTCASRRSSPAAAPLPAIAPHRRPRDPHRDRQRRRPRGDLRPPGDRLRRGPATSLLALSTSGGSANVHRRAGRGAPPRAGHASRFVGYDGGRMATAARAPTDHVVVVPLAASSRGSRRRRRPPTTCSAELTAVGVSDPVARPASRAWTASCRASASGRSCTALAAELGLAGLVAQRPGGVVVEVEGPAGGGRRASSPRCVPGAPPLARGGAPSTTRSLPRGGAVRLRASCRATPDGRGRAPGLARRGDLRRLPARAVRPGRPALPLPVHQLHQLRPALHHHPRRPVRPPADDDGRLPRCAPAAAPSTTTRATGASTPSRSPARPAGRALWLVDASGPAAGRRPGGRAAQLLRAAARSSRSRGSAASTWPATPQPSAAVGALRGASTARRSRSRVMARDLGRARALVELDRGRRARC